MTNRKFFSVSDFAKLSRTTRDTLHHYDRVGLLAPNSRGKNNYRYYSSRQLAQVNLIRILQDMGMTLTEIKLLKDERTPEFMDEILGAHIEKIDRKIVDLINSRKLLFTIRQTIHSALQVDERAISLQSLPAEAIIMGETNDYSNGRDDYDALLDFYHAINDKYLDVDLNYPVWGAFSQKRIKQRDWYRPDRYYFYNPQGHDQRPAALYVIGYTRGGYGQSNGLYPRLLDFIDNNGLEINGDAYEEYPLNEMCISSENNYLIRVMIRVCER